MEVLGTTSSTGRMLIKADKFTGYAFDADSATSIEIKDSDGNIVSTTPSLGTKEKWKFTVKKDCTYYIKCDPDAGLKIVGNILLVEE